MLKERFIRRITFLLLLVAGSPLMLLAQNKTVTGTVMDGTLKEPMIGVTITVKEAPGIGTVTDYDGNFSLSIPTNSTLVFSYIGYQSKEMAPKTDRVLVELSEESMAIDEILIVGTRMKKSDLTGAVGGISSEKLKEVPTTDLTVAMQGKVPGLFVQRNEASPGGDVKVRIRGNNSINFGQEPVYVVDGMIVEQGLRLINPDDIESIEVLKDASSTALYGSRASNGVIVITTKKGQKGEGKINYSGFVTYSEYQNKLKRLDARQLYDLRIDAYANAYMDLNPTANRQEYINTVLTQPSVVGSIFSAEEVANGQANNSSDWLDEVLRTGMTQNHSLSFSGANDNTTYYFGFTFSDEKGVLKNSDYQRISGKVSLEQKVKSWLKVGTNTMIMQGKKGVLEGDAYNVAFRGNPLQTIDTDRYYMYWQGVAQMGEYNPILSQDIEREELHNRILSSNFAEINPLKDLYFRTTFSLDLFNKQDNRYTPSYVGQSVRDNYGGVGWQWRSKDIYWEWNNSISYEKTFNEKHRILGVVSTSMTKKRYDVVSIEGFNFPIDDYGYHNMGFAANKDLNKMNSEYITSTIASYLARVNYSYESKYFLTATVRRDGSSKFASGNQWGTFPSFSAAWNISEESFLDNAEWLDMLKLRVGYGIVGNQNIDDYRYLTIMNPKYSNGQVTFVPDDMRLENKDIRWEKQKQGNVGIDASFLNDRFSFGVDAFYMLNSDLLMKMNLYPSRGYDYMVANIAELENKGVEFNFNAKLITTKDFNWTFSGNIAHDNNKIKKLFEGVDVIWNGGNIRNRDGNLFVGQSLNTVYSMKLDKIAQESDKGYIDGLTSIADGKVIRPGDYLPLDANNDGKITYEEDMVIIGKKDPKFYGGFSNNLSYKGVSLDAVFTYSYGAKRFSGMYETMLNGSGTTIASTDMLDRWTPENTNTDIPRAWRGIGENRFSISELDASILDASFLRCAALTLSYDLPKPIVSKFAQNLRVYATANNLFIVTPYKGYDPEAGEGYPLTRSFTVGLNVTF